MRYGDWIVILSMLLNASAAGLYAWQFHWWNALYWFAAFLLNLCVLNLK